MPHLQKLETLNVGDCLLKDIGAIVLAPALAVEMPCLKVSVLLDFEKVTSVDERTPTLVVKIVYVRKGKLVNSLVSLSFYTQFVM